MTRFAFARSALLALATLSSLASVGCNKPSKDECRRAIDNMRGIMGTDLLQESDTQGWIRRCNGGSKKEAVLCAIKATNMDELRACKFMHLPNGKGVGDQPFPGEGSATPSMTPTGGSGSAATAPAASGSAGTSAATGSNVGSAVQPANAGITADTGSGSGATAGSAATGSGSGATTGSAAGAGAPATGSGGPAAGSAAPAMGGAGSGSAAPSMGGAAAGSAH